MEEVVSLDFPRVKDESSVFVRRANVINTPDSDRDQG